ncbi:MAG: FHA domain-containing protein [Victivallaceae bacterium]|jgi:pSer/pThr/pTyr-binding forkhead associated (FHA) protein
MKIYFINGAKTGESAELSKPEMSIGRENDNDISISTVGVSRYHARFVCGGDGRWTVVDQKSTNGVMVNNDAVDGSRLLEEGDILTLGDQTIRFGGEKDMKVETPEIELESKPETEEYVLQPFRTVVIKAENKPVTPKSNSESNK